MLDTADGFAVYAQVMKSASIPSSDGENSGPLFMQLRMFTSCCCGAGQSSRFCCIFIIMYACVFIDAFLNK